MELVRAIRNCLACQVWHACRRLPTRAFDVFVGRKIYSTLIFVLTPVFSLDFLSAVRKILLHFVEVFHFFSLSYFCISQNCADVCGWLVKTFYDDDLFNKFQSWSGQESRGLVSHEDTTLGTPRESRWEAWPIRSGRVQLYGTATVDKHFPPPY